MTVAMTAAFLPFLSALAAELPEVAPPEATAEATPEEAVPAGPDRSKPPEVPAPDLLSHPDAEIHTLSPGVDVWYVRTPGVRKVAIHAVFRRGLHELDKGTTQLGRATGSLVSTAGADLSGGALSAQCDIFEVDLQSWAGQHDSGMLLTVPLENLATGLGLEQKVLRTPSFPKKDVKRWVLDQTLFYTVNGPSSQSRVASSAMSFAWFPADHPYGTRPALDELKAVKTKAMQARWASWLGSVPITLVVAGDAPYGDVEPLLKPLFAGIGADVPPGKAVAFDAPAKTKVIAVHMPGQAQAALRLRLAAPPRDHEDETAFEAMNFLLGGHFLSRLNRNLRENKGYTYGVGSSFSNAETWGSLSVGVDVKAENASETIVEIERELGRLRTEAVPEEELDAMRRSYNADWNRTFETAQRAVGLYRHALSEDTTISGLREDLVKLNAVTEADIARVAGTWFGEEQARVWVIVGDRAAIEPELAAAGLTAVWTDPRSAILGKF